MIGLGNLSVEVLRSLPYFCYAGTGGSTNNIARKELTAVRKGLGKYTEEENKIETIMIAGFSLQDGDVVGMTLLYLIAFDLLSL